MEEIKVNEYVITDNGIIGKYIIQQDINYIDTGKQFIGFDIENDIVKHSPNIIDLLEKNDIAEVLDNWSGNKQIIYIYDDSYISELKLDIKNGFLKLLSITTEEQFNQVKYEV